MFMMLITYVTKNDTKRMYAGGCIKCHNKDEKSFGVKMRHFNGSGRVNADLL